MTSFAFSLNRKYRLTEKIILNQNRNIQIEENNGFVATEKKTITETRVAAKKQGKFFSVCFVYVTTFVCSRVEYSARV